MSNRMVEASKNGGLGGLGLGDDHQKNSSGILSSPDTKDFIAKYKENEMRNSNSASGISMSSGDHPMNSSNHHNHGHHPMSSSPRLNSPNSSSEGGSSMGRVSVSSPYSSLFEAAKVPAFPSPFLSASASLGPSMAAAAAAAAAANQQHQQNQMNHDFQKEFNNLASRFNPAAAAAAAAAAAGLTPLSTSNISPLSPLNAAVSRLFLQNTSALLEKRFSDLQKLQSAEQLFQASRFLPLQAAALSSVLKQQQSSPAKSGRGSLSEDMELEMAAAAGGEALASMLQLQPQFYGAEVPEQDRPIDLSVKRLDEYKELRLLAESGSSKCSGKTVPGDHDSGFSPSSNEDTHTSPLDLTAPAKRGRPGSGGSALGGSYHSLLSGRSNNGNHKSHHRGAHLSGSISRHRDNQRRHHLEDDEGEEEEEDEHVDVEEDEDEAEDTSDVEVHDQMMDTSSAADRVQKTDARQEIECAP